jgi:membrane protein
MACLSDVPKVMRSIGLKELVQRVWHQMVEDSLLALAAALAYAWLFAIFPFLIFLLGLLPYLPQSAKNEAAVEIPAWLDSVLSEQAAVTIWSNLSDVLDKPRTSLLGVGLVLMLWGASGGMNMTITALDRCYELKRGRAFYWQRPLAMLMTIIVAVLVILILVLLPIGTIAMHWIEARGYTYISRPLLVSSSILRYPAALLMMFTVIHVIYQYGPHIRQKFVFVTPGAVFTVATWLIGGVLFRWYVSHFGKFNQTYGTVGGVAVLLLFFYIDSAVLLIGAEINSEIDFEVLKVPRGSSDFTKRVSEGVALEMGETSE